jgi:hypothetical protein
MFELCFENIQINRVDSNKNTGFNVTPFGFTLSEAFHAKK